MSIRAVLTLSLPLVSSFDSKYSDTQCKNLLYYFANPNLQCAPLWTMSSDFYTYPHVCSYSAGNCVGTCTDYYLNATCTKTGSGDVSKGARMSSYQVVLIDASSNPQTTNNSKDEWYSSTGAVVGFTIGGVALIVIIVAVVFFATASGWKVIRHAGGTRTERKSLVELDSTVSALRKSHDASMNHNQA